MHVFRAEKSRGMRGHVQLPFPARSKLYFRQCRFSWGCALKIAATERRAPPFPLYKISDFLKSCMQYAKLQRTLFRFEDDRRGVPRNRQVLPCCSWAVPIVHGNTQVAITVLLIKFNQIILIFCNFCCDCFKNRSKCRNIHNQKSLVYLLWLV